MVLKDINQMVLAGYSVSYIEQIIQENTFSGLRLNLEWSKRQ